MTITRRRQLPVLLAGVGTATAIFALPIWAEPGVSPLTHWKYAAKPPMGWNSYDSFGDSVTEAEVLANAEYMQDHLLSHGWNYEVVDFRWYDPGAHSGDPNNRAGVALTADAFGRLQPATNRFPSAAGGEGFRPLADKIHAMGLRFGIHVMRGIPRQAVNANTPIKDSRFHAVDAVNQDRLGKPGLRVVQHNGIEVWVKESEENTKTIAFFNRGLQDTEATFKWSDVGLAGKQSARDLWFHRDLGFFKGQISLLVPKHGAVFLINNARK